MEECVIMQEETEKAPIEVSDDAVAVTETAEGAPTEASEDEATPPCIPEEDKYELLRLFTPEDVATVTEEDTVRYISLRALGLSPKEAYLAANGDKTLERIDGARRALSRLLHDKQESKAHVTSAALGAAASASAMPRDALLEARALFSGMSDKEIERLYHRARGGA